MLKEKMKKILQSIEKFITEEKYFFTRFEMQIVDYSKNVSAERSRTEIFSAVSLKTLEREYFRFYPALDFLERLSREEIEMVRESIRKDKEARLEWREFNF